MALIEYKLVKQKLTWGTEKKHRTVADLLPPDGSGWVLQSVAHVDESGVFAVWQRAAVDPS